CPDLVQNAVNSRCSHDRLQAVDRAPQLAASVGPIGPLDTLAAVRTRVLNPVSGSPDVKDVATATSEFPSIRIVRRGNRPPRLARMERAGNNFPKFSQSRPSCGKVSRPCHLADRMSPTPSPAADLRSSRRRGLETRAEPRPAADPRSSGRRGLETRAEPPT